MRIKIALADGVKRNWSRHCLGCVARVNFNPDFATPQRTRANRHSNSAAAVWQCPLAPFQPPRHLFDRGAGHTRECASFRSASCRRRNCGKFPPFGPAGRLASSTFVLTGAGDQADELTGPPRTCSNTCARSATQHWQRKTSRRPATSRSSPSSASVTRQPDRHPSI